VFVVSDPSDKNKNVARMGHPAPWHPALHPAMGQPEELSPQTRFGGICGVLRLKMSLLRDFAKRNFFGFLSRGYVARLSVLFS